MIVDFRAVEDGAAVEADLCVIGAAGIALAREFAGTPVRVCLVESGGLDFDPDTQGLYVGESVGLPYHELDGARLRYFGGTTNHWTGHCAPLAPLDFRERPWVPHSGWPLARTELEPFYRRAQAVCQLAAFAYGEEVWPALGLRPHDFDSDRVRLSFWQHSPPTRFGEVYRAELARAGNVRVLLHANAVHLRADESAAAVRRVDLRALDGGTGHVEARFYVLACGGIENARLLLVSDSVEAAGLGNRHDLVGRFFMEHLYGDPAIVLAGDADRLAALYRRRRHRGVVHEPSFCAGEAMQEREQVLNSQAALRHTADRHPAARTALGLWHDVRAGRMPDDLAGRIWRVVRDLDDVARFAYRRVADRPPYDPVQSLFFHLGSEQAPNPESRVTLARQRDALGLRRVRLDWRLTDLDRRSIEAMTRTLGAEFARLGLGRVRLADWLLDDGGSAWWRTEVHGGRHHMGTTRMATDPRRGVVDRNCRMHHVENLYVAGSSVFPTGGSANPTLTIVALALRLADHLKLRLA